MQNQKANKKAIFIAIIMLASIITSLSMNEIPITKAEDLGGSTVIWEPGKTITGTEEYSNGTIIVQGGDLVIQNGGSLTLRNIDLKIQAVSGDGQPRRWIDVQGGGALYVYDNDNDPTTTSDGSLITRRDSDGDQFRFRVRSGGTLVIKNSEVQRCGRTSSFAGTKDKGIYVESNNVVIENTSFRNCYRAIQLTSGINSVKIVNNTFQDILSGGDGIRFIDADNNVKIDKNTFNVSSSNEDGFRGTSSSTNNKGYNSTFAGSGLYVNLDGGSTLILVNSTNQGSGGVSISSDSTLTLKNFLEVKTVDGNDAPIENVTVSVKEDGVEVFTGNTNSQGKISWIEVAYIKYAGSNNPTRINVEVNVSKDGLTFQDAPRTVDMSSSHTETFTATISNTPPNITSSPITQVNEDELYEYQVNATDKEGQNITFYLEISPQGMNISEISNTSALIQWTPTNDDVGNHTIKIKAEDEKGKSSLQTFNLTVINVNDAPVIQGIPNLTIPAENDYIYDIYSYVSDVDNSTEQLTITTNSSYISVNGTNLTFNYPQTIENDRVNITVSDGLLSSSQEINLTIFYNEPPTISGVPDQNGTEDISWQLDVFSYVNDSDNGTANLTISTNSAYVSVNGFNLTFLYPNGITSDKVNITVSDGWLSAFQEINVSISPVNDAPVIQEIPNQTVFEDIKLIFSLENYVYDIDSDELNVSTNSENVSVNMENGTLEFLYNLPIENVTIILYVDDGEYNVSTTINITIISMNDAPIISNIPNLNLTEDIAYTLDLTSYISDEDNATSQLIISVNSSYASLNETNLTFLYPNGITYEIVRLNVSDNISSSYQDININITPINDAPIILSIPQQYGYPEEEWSLDLTPYIYDEDNPIDELTISIISDNASLNGTIITFFYENGTAYDNITLNVSDGEYDTTSIIKVRIIYAPNITGVPNLNLTEDIAYILDLSQYITDYDSSSSELIVSTNSSYISVNGLNLTFLYTSSTLSYEKVRLTVKDERNASSYQDIEVNITLVNDAPKVSSIINQTAKSDLTFQLNMHPYIYDEDNTTSELIISTNSTYATVNGEIINFLFPWNSTLKHTAYITVSDGINNTTTTVNITIKHQPKITTPIPNQIKYEETSWEIDLSPYFYDPDSSLSQITVLISAPSAIPKVNGTKIVFNYTYGFTTEDITVRIRDEVFNEASQTVKIRIYYYPRISAIPNQTGYEDISWQLDLTSYITDYDTQMDDIILIVNSSYISISGRVLTFLYPNGVLNDMIIVEVSDGILNATTQINISIIPVPDPPVILQIPTIYVVEGISYDFDLSPYLQDVDTPINKLFVMANSKYVVPKGQILSLLYPTRMINDTFEILVLDDEFLGASQTVNVSILPFNDPPTISEIPKVIVYEDEAYSLNITEYIYDADNRSEEFIITTDSSYISVNGTILTFLYPNGILSEDVKITVSDGENYVNATIKVQVIPVNDLPEIKITSPIENQEITGTLKITGNIIDIDSENIVVEIKINNESWTDVGNTKNWEYSWNTTDYENGKYTIYARAYDGIGYSKNSTVNITVKHDYLFMISLMNNRNDIAQGDEGVYYLKIENKGDTKNEINLTALNSNNFIVRFEENPVKLSYGEKKTIIVYVKVSADEPLGEKQFTLKAKSFLGGEKTATIVVSIIKINPSLSVEILFPKNEQNVKDSITIFGKISENTNEAQVQISIDGGVWNTATLKDGSWNYNLENLANGKHTVYAKAFANNEYSKTVNVTFFVDKNYVNQIPIALITSPKNNEKVSGKITVSGVAYDDNSVVRIRIKIDNGDWIEVGENNIWNYEIDTNKLTSGRHTISAIAFDGMNYSKIDTIDINVDNGFKLPETVPFYYLVIALIVIVILALLSVRGVRKPPSPKGKKTIAEKPKQIKKMEENFAKKPKEKMPTIEQHKEVETKQITERSVEQTTEEQKVQEQKDEFIEEKTETHEIKEDEKGETKEIPSKEQITNAEKENEIMQEETNL